MSGNKHQQLDFYRMFCNLVNAHFAIIDDIFPKGDSAIYISFSQDITEDTLKDVLSGSGWHITKSDSRNAVIEPRYTNSHELMPGSLLFHVSDIKNRDSIQKKGLLLKEGGNTGLNRNYPPRVYFATNILAAFEFIDFQCKTRPVSFKEGKFGPKPTARKPAELDLYRVDVPPEIKFYTDPFFSGQKAIWCEAPIPKQHLLLIEDWQSLRAQIEGLITIRFCWIHLKKSLTCKRAF